MTIHNADSASWTVRAAFAVMLSYALMAPALALSAEATAPVAADAKKDEAKLEDELEEVKITGTRIQTPGATSANPIESITAEDMRRLGIVNIADALTQLLPQNISSYMPTLTGDNQAGTGGGGMERMDRSSFFIGNTIANLRGLDPTFGSRTLTLVDGRRLPSTSNQADVVDLNIIPSNLLQRMDVVTGGASATYGSGAMAGVVNLVLNNRLTGFNLDMDYGFNEAGDGGSPHVSLSGGLPLFGGKGHMLVGAEWQDTSAIRNCAAARDWCAESRTMFTNFTGSGQDPKAGFTPLPGFEGMPAHFQLANMHRGQFAPTGTIAFNNVNVTSNLRFAEDGMGDSTPYALGYRGGTGGDAVNGDGPLSTWLTTMQPSTERKSLFVNFEYNLTERTTAYVQANYAQTYSKNKNAYTTGNYCVRFNSQGVAAQIGATVRQGEPVGFAVGPPFFGVTAEFYDYVSPTQVGARITNLPARGGAFSNANFRQWLGIKYGPPPGSENGPPFFITPSNFATYINPATQRPYDDMFQNATAVYAHIYFSFPFGVPAGTPPTASPSAEYWWLISLTPKEDFNDPGVPAVLPTQGADSYAFLNGLSPEARSQIQSAFGVGGNHGALVDPQTGQLLAGASNIAGGGTGLDTIYGPTPCDGYTPIRKVWNPQFDQWTTQLQTPWRAVAGLRGRFGRDWRWEAYYQHGRTDSKSKQNNVATSIRQAMAVDAVIDNRHFLADGVTLNPTEGQPVCRVTRDGVPVIDYQGRPLSDVAALQSLAADCHPLNLFGNVYDDYDYFDGTGNNHPYDAAEEQREAIDYAFVQSVSSGFNSLQTLSFTTSGTLWDGIGAGPLTGAFGLEARLDKVANEGTSSSASYYERADLGSAWADGFGGKTRVTEGYTELNMPLVSGQPGINLLSVNTAVRYGSYYNKGGAGTTGASATQNVLNWKLSTLFEPFDWLRFRLTRSRDVRAAGYRDLFIQQPGLPDQFTDANPWRPYNSLSTEGRRERYGQVRVGNPELKPESSDTLTLGLVLSPGGWAQGMRLSVDYYNIHVKDGITTPFIGSTTANITSCWENSADENGNLNQDPTPQNPGREARNGAFDYDFFDAALGRYPCREITFGTNADGSRNLQDIVTYNSARPVNALPYQRRGLDLSWSYIFPLNRAFETLPGSVSLTARATRAMESSGIQVRSFAQGDGPTQCAAQGGTYNDFNCYIPVDLVGQIRSSVFIPGVAASPKWSGNFQTSYILGDLTTTLSARYVGGAFLDKTWCDSDSAACPNYKDANGNFLVGSVDNNWVKPYFNFSLNGSYNMKVANMKQFQVFGSINNLLDKSPPFTGGGISGASPQYHDIMGRAYRMGVRLRF